MRSGGCPHRGKTSGSVVGYLAEFELCRGELGRHRGALGQGWNLGKIGEKGQMVAGGLKEANGISRP
jgi:hypothetical protein